MGECLHVDGGPQLAVAVFGCACRAELSCGKDLPFSLAK